MPNYQEIEAHHLREPLTQPAHDEEETVDSFFECHNCGYMIVNFTEDDYLDDFGSLCYCQVEAHQEEDSTTEQEETMSTNEKAAAEAGTSTTVQECSQNNSVSILYMLQRSNGTADSFGTWGGQLLPKSDYIEVAVRFTDLQKAFRAGSHLFHADADCVRAYDAEIFRLREEEARKQHREQEESARRREEDELIRSITGMDLVRDDLVVFMTQARRDGEDFQPFLDALQAIDDLDLKRAGRTTWDVDLDALEEGGDDA